MTAVEYAHVTPDHLRREDQLMAGRTLVFLDCETTSLRADREPWEVALIVRPWGGPDIERHWFLDVDLTRADPASLTIGGYYARHPAEHESTDWEGDNTRAAKEIDRLTRDATIVGACPWFDTGTLDPFLRKHGRLPGWHHRLICVESLTAGNQGRLIGGLANCADTLGLDFPDQHTALADARMVRAIYDHIIARPRETQ